MIDKSISFLQERKEGAIIHRQRRLAEMATRKLRPHQDDAVTKICDHFATHSDCVAEAKATARSPDHDEEEEEEEEEEFDDNFGRYVSVIMATGSGKTLTAYAATTELEKKFNIQSPSLHISPMIRLVFQNAHEWLAEDIAKWVTKQRDKTPAEIDYSDYPIYYAVCSSHDDSSRGCTSLSSIHMNELADTLERHAKTDSLHRCRFFTTFQNGSLFWMKVREFCIQRYGDPLHRVFGVAVRDEAHTAAGLGSKSYAMVLNVRSQYSLSFTATPKIQKGRFEEHTKDDAIIEEELQKGKMTYLHLKHEIMLPYVENTEKITCPLHKDNTKRHPFDFLSENLLFEEIESTTSTTDSYDWCYFQNQAEDHIKPMIVFFVEPVQTSIVDSAASGKYDDLYDLTRKNFRFFGPLFPPSDGDVALTNDGLCFGVTKNFKTLCKPWGKKRDLVIHDMSPFGTGNYIGPIIHTLSYQECIASERLSGPRLVMLKPRALEESEYRPFILEKNLEKLPGCDEITKKHTAPGTERWRLSINNRVVEGTAHHFRAMQQLMACFQLVKPVYRVVVFCTKGEHAQECMDIFHALLSKKHDLRLNEEGQSQFYVCRIFSSDVHTKETMSYSEQQEHLLKFARHKYGVIFNVRLVGIGVDMPGIDAVQIVPVIQSVSKIIQGYGRAMRLDSKFEGQKKATFIIPAVSPFKTDWEEEIKASATDLDLSSTPSQQNAQNTCHLGNMERLLSSKNTVAAPVLPDYENAYHLQVKLVKLMRDENVKVISERFRGTQIEGTSNTAAKATPNPKPYEGETAEKLVKNITPDAAPKNVVPILGEELSDILLKAWNAVEVSDLNGDALDMPGPIPISEEHFEEACSVLANGLARTFALKRDDLWKYSYCPKKISGGKEKAVGKMKDMLQNDEFGAWDRAKTEIRRLILSGFPDAWGIKIECGEEVKRKFPKGKIPKTPKKHEETQILTIYSHLSVEELMAKLDEDIPDPTTPATGAIQAMETTPATPPSPPTTTGSTDGAGPSTSRAAEQSREGNPTNDPVVKTLRL
ncbi:hypothetical protein KSW81_007471 [Nannochloris sp. 'desiccata']|nr:hypothetical protein KSW81_007471 [Chlorella desiccata (nom. nud.)]